MANTIKCVVCFERKPVGKRVGPYAVCSPCIVEGIVPMFHEALKSEINYRPSFGEGITLDPFDFLQYFDSPHQLLQQWVEKTREHDTPYKARFYCSGCGTCLCAKPQGGSKPNIRCCRCDTWTCFPCGGNAGKPCSRWNHPNAPNATYDNDDFGPRVQHILYTEINGEDAENEIIPDAFTDDLLFRAIGRGAYNALISGTVGVMDDLPALPDLANMSTEQQLQAERDMTPALRASAIGQRMLGHQATLEIMIDNAEARIAEAENEDSPVPEWASAGVCLFRDLQTNLDMYTNRVQLRAEFDAFNERHEEINRMAFGPLQGELFARFPHFYEILTPYLTVAEIHLMAAEAELSGDEQDRAMARAERARIQELWAMVPHP